MGFITNYKFPKEKKNQSIRLNYSQLLLKTWPGDFAICGTSSGKPFAQQDWQVA
jgi:hypothetical protein